jgi:TetR/AcrR family transcriptional regulator, transcriptional repressor for nem operon
MKSNILEAGTALLWQNGYSGTGIQEITQAAGVPKGSFYNHFASKELLALEAIDAYERASADSLIPLHNDSLAPYERLLSYFDSQIATVASMGYRRGCLLGNLALEMADHSELIRQRVLDAFHGWATQLEPVIAQGQEFGDITTSVTAGTLARFLLDAWEGAVLRSRSEGDGDAFDAFRLVALRAIRP